MTVILIFLLLRKLQREAPEMFDGVIAAAEIEAVLLEEGGDAV